MLITEVRAQSKKNINVPPAKYELGAMVNIRTTLNNNGFEQITSREGYISSTYLKYFEGDYYQWGYIRMYTISSSHMLYDCIKHVKEDDVIPAQEEEK